MLSEKLKGLIEKARHYRMSPEELTEQEIGFAYGNAHFENDRITREMVARALPASKGDRATVETAAH
jgi:hypothetical protein